MSIPMLEGQAATFILQDSRTRPGQYEGKDVTLIEAHEGKADGQTGDGTSTAPTSAIELVGMRINGTIKSFNSDKAWGFITSPQCPEDIFVSFKTAPQLRAVEKQYGSLQGLQANFILAESRSGQGGFEAQHVRVQPPYGPHAGMMGGRKGKGAGCGPYGGCGMGDYYGMGEKGMGGYGMGGYGMGGYGMGGYDMGGYGMGGYDMGYGMGGYDMGGYGMKGMKGMMMGGMCGKGMGKAGKGKSFANGFKGGKAKAHSGGMSPPANDWRMGVIKSFNAGNGWGFITCEELGADVFVSYKTAPDLRSLVSTRGAIDGLPVQFALAESQNNPGQFEARGIKLADEQGGGGGGGDSQRCTGFFKSFSEASGWGFLTAPGIEEDILVSFKTSPGLRELATAFGPLEGHEASFMIRPSESGVAPYEATQVQLMSGS